MDQERSYFDVDGDKVTLAVLCKRAPEWAASRIDQLKLDLQRHRDQEGESTAEKQYPMPWTKVTDNMPAPGKAVLAVFQDERYPNGPVKKMVQVVVRAFWVPQWFELAGDDDDVSEYSEEKDEYYVPQGWYEMNEEEEIHWKLPDTVTHWMPLPEPPGLCVPGAK